MMTHFHSFPPLISYSLYAPNSFTDRQMERQKEKEGNHSHSSVLGYPRVLVLRKHKAVNTPSTDDTPAEAERVYYNQPKPLH